MYLLFVFVRKSLFISLLTLFQEIDSQTTSFIILRAEGTTMASLWLPIQKSIRSRIRLHKIQLYMSCTKRSTPNLLTANSIYFNVLPNFLNYSFQTLLFIFIPSLIYKNFILNRHIINLPFEHALQYLLCPIDVSVEFHEYTPLTCQNFFHPHNP